jgi:hypothetical protein
LATLATRHRRGSISRFDSVRLGNARRLVAARPHDSRNTFFYLLAIRRTSDRFRPVCIRVRSRGPLITDRRGMTLRNRRYADRNMTSSPRRKIFV